MERQQHNYEYGETFGFINPPFAESENFSTNQEEDASKAKIPSLMPDFNPPTTTDFHNPSSLYNLPAEYSELPPKTLGEKKEGIQSNLNKQPNPAMGTDDSTPKSPDIGTSVDVQNSPENSENIHEDIEKSTENATSDEKVVETLSPREAESSENINNENTQKADDSKSSKKNSKLKKRRRIVLLSDEDSEDENELKNLSKSSDIEQDDKQTEKSNEVDADNESDSEDENVKELAVNPNRNFLKAKYLLKSAVIIQGPDKKKKKKHRVLDSDDEDQIHTSIDDIGLITNENENENEEEEMFPDDIVILNNDPIEATEENPDDLSTATENPEKESDLEKKEDVSDKTEEVSQSVDTISEKTEEKDANQDEEEPSKQESAEQSVEKNEEEDVEAVLDKIQPMDDDDDFFKFNDSTDDEKNDVPNDKYFGTPDKMGSNTAIRGRKRGPKSGNRRKVSESGKSAQPRKRGSKYERDFVDDSDSSSYSESISSSSSISSESSSSSREKVKRPAPAKSIPPSFKPVVKKFASTPQIPVRSVTFTKVPTKKEIEQKDRFYDKSRNIPNDVYFGDVKVPLHVLHSRWNNDGTSDRMRKVQRMPINANRSVQRTVNVPTSIKIQSTSKIPGVIPQLQIHPRPGIQNFRAQQEDESRLTVMKEFMRVCGLKINYAKLFNNVKSVDHKCSLLRRILVQKGMDGEPTLAKCKKLKLELQAKRESAELDKSVILPTEGRTRRSKRGVSSKDSEPSSNNEAEPTNVQPEVLETLTKIKSVIDSDSD